MFFTVIIGIILRLVYIIKPEGLWNDEYVSWQIANTAFNEGFWPAVLKQCHMPLYYLYLKPFAHLSDTILRLTSVVPGIVSIFVMYLVGKEYSKKAGLFSALITSFLTFLVYYSQEVRFYSLLFFFSAISLLFTIKLIKNSNRANIILYLLSLILIVFTHVLGIIYVFFNTLYVCLKSKTLRLPLVICQILAILIIIPFGMNILAQLPSSQWWGHFSYTNLLFLFSDFFSPILTNNINAPQVFFYSKSNALWMLVPTLISGFAILTGFRKNKGLLSVAICTICTISVLAFFGKIVFITKYLIEILPIFIFVMACTFDDLKKFGLVCLTTFLSIHIFYFFTPSYPTKILRDEGNKLVGDIINLRKPTDIIYTYYEPDRFFRYVNDTHNNYHISKFNRFDYVDNPQKIFENLKPNESFSVVFLDSVSFVPQEYFDLKTNPKNIPEMFLTFSKIRLNLAEYIDKHYNNIKVDKAGSWTIVTVEPNN